MNDTTYKTCRRCNLSKPLTAFYSHRNGKPYAVCIPCHLERSKSYPEKPKNDASRKHEQTCMEYMRSLGIHTNPGKYHQFKWVDLVVWGFIRVEVKFGERVPGREGSSSWLFRFTDMQVNERLLADVIVLILPRDTWEYYIFDVNHPVFYKNGKLKTGVQYLENPGTRKYRAESIPMTHEMMNEARDNWAILYSKLPDLKSVKKRAVTQSSKDKPMQKVLI